MAMPSTLMVKNLPSRWSSEEVTRVIDEELGFGGTYDLFYMPRRSSSEKSQALGYAFINFKEPVFGERFCAAAQNGLLKFRNRLATVAPATIQGLENLNKHLKTKRVTKWRGGAPKAEEVATPREEALPRLALGSTGGASRGSEPAGPVKNMAKQQARSWADILDDDDDDDSCFSQDCHAFQASPTVPTASTAAACPAQEEHAKVMKQPSKRWADIFDDEDNFC
eukprot:TRINITY_DN10530_c0_g2_i1.p1 TRINITY_DN10530_c0_g2~~TRINITY_DN10530_c0_g2_i1.p1  ORF type:complete len:224 (+),score=64.38 TRINITY_DN10530_c0_g2_i1:100-771(+)